MHLRSIPLSECEAFGHGVKRPEDVVVSRDGTVWLSDQDSACARVNDDGSLSRVGQAGGAPTVDPVGFYGGVAMVVDAHARLGVGEDVIVLEGAARLVRIL